MQSFRSWRSEVCENWKTPHLAFRKSRLGRAWMVVRYKLKSLDWGLNTTNSHVVVGASGYIFHPLPWPPPPLPGVMNLPFPSLQFTIMKSWESSPLPTLPVIRVSFFLLYFYVSSVFWLFFQVNLILINHPHRPSLAKSEWWVCRKVVVKHSINPNLSQCNTFTNKYSENTNALISMSRDHIWLSQYNVR